jgi:hypothetical protein
VCLKAENNTEGNENGLKPAISEETAQMEKT